jgi:hypothetical protein
MQKDEVAQQYYQTTLPGICPIEETLVNFATAGNQERGVIYTRQEVVTFILDLVGYTADKPLYRHQLLEPSFGEGDFLFVAVERLLKSWKRYGDGTEPYIAMKDSIRGVELHEASFMHTRKVIATMLEQADIDPETSTALVTDWLICSDYLLTPFQSEFDYVIGNPPYVRQELIPDALISEYRSHYKTIFDRADLYIPFIERSLSLLKEGGELGFICADRWMKNRYGKRLRRMVANHFHLRFYIDMVNTQAFYKDVMAYPAIIVIGNEKPGKTRVSHRPQISYNFLEHLAFILKADETPEQDGLVKELAEVTNGYEPWILESFDQLALARRLEQKFATIEDAGCKVGIGVATGADKAFIDQYDQIDVEPDRKLPLVKTQDILSGEVIWQGFGIVNPFSDKGNLVNLKDYPKLKQYLEMRKDQLSRRHIAKKAPTNWYRTIDRIYPALAQKPKLLIPDIKGKAQIVYEDGKFYPHHNLYYIVSNEWDLRALQAVLRSGIARLFVKIYSTQMRGGYFRFQAQYLRRIRLPHWHDISGRIKNQLINAVVEGDIQSCNEAVFNLYGLSSEERIAIGANE